MMEQDRARTINGRLIALSTFNAGQGCECCKSIRLSGLSKILLLTNDFGLISSSILA